ncbi:MAG TPA: hypothetical protein ENK98_04745 [Epsilonproteobacteria bacterium]|nr:hypothetical protein [Campylobacterota bacterium]
MRTLFKYLLITFLFVFAFISYLFFTNSGQKTVYNILSFVATHKAGVDIAVKQINLHQYPYVWADIVVEEQYVMHIDGFMQKQHFDLRYTLHSSCLKSNICTFDDEINIIGKATGWKNNINVTGQGSALDGNVSYSFVKKKHIFKDIDLNLHDVNSSKLSSLLKQKALFKGKAQSHIHFDVIEKKHKVGTIDYEVNDKRFFGLDAALKMHIAVNNHHHTFSADLRTPELVLHLTEGKYNQEKKYAHANYTLEAQDLSKLKKLLHANVKGSFHTHGEVIYDKHINITGVSQDLGGALHFNFDQKNLTLLFKNVSFIKLMRMLNTKAILDANATGQATFNITQKEMYLNTQLVGAKLLPSKLTQEIGKKFHFKLSQQVFNKSHIKMHYKEKELISDITLANDNIRLSLKNTKINALHNAIDTYMDIEIPHHAAQGQLYARVDDIKAKKLDDVYVKFDGTLEKHYQVKLDGLVSERFVNMDYVLSSARLPSHVCTIVDDVNLSGHLSGSFARLHVTSTGTAMEGHVQFSAIKRKKRWEDIVLDFKNIHALKLFTLLGQPTLPSGKATISATLDYIDADRQKAQGHLDYGLSQGMYKSLPLTLHANFDIHNKDILFTSNAKLSTADINISKGKYNLETNTSQAFYTLTTKNLAPLKPLIGAYLGAFTSSGELHYNKDLQIRGLSNSFGGMVDYLYKKDMLYIDLEKVSLKRFMSLFTYPHILDAQLNGNINYDYKQEKLLVRTDLNNTRFLNSDLVETVFQKSGVNMLKEVFPQSTLHASYQNDIVLGDVALKNKQSHFYFSNVKMDEKHNTVNAYFDLKMQGQEFSGKVYGSLKHPKVNLNMQKLIRYQMDKQLDTYMGKSNRKLMEAMPMGGVAKDMASEVGGDFLDMFF